MSERKNYQICYLAIILLILSVLVGCLKKEPVKVAFVGSLTGRYSEIGVSSRNSVLMAVDEWNQKGGIKGRPIELAIIDDEGDPEKGKDVDSKVIKDGNKFIIGHFTSNLTPAIVDKRNEDVLYMSPTMSTSELSVLGDNFIRAIPPCSRQSKLLATAMQDNNIKRCFIIYDSQNGVYTKDVMNNFIKEIMLLDNAFQYSIDSIYKPTNEVLNKKANLAIEYKPEAVLIITNGIDFAKMSQQLKRLKYNGALYGPRWSSTKDVIIHGGKSVEGAIFATGDQSKKQTGINKPLFYDRYKTRYGRKPINFIPVFAYDAANILFEGMETSKELTPVNVRNTIINIGIFDGVDEKIKIDDMGDAHRSISLMQIKNGKFVNVE